MTSLSLCMIVRDEAQNIARCLNSVQGVADEIVIVDTGSTDDTVALCEAMGARVWQQPWQDDFSRARNAALDRANGEWIFVLDADDEVDPRDRLKIRPLLDDSSADAYFFVTENWVGSLEDPLSIRYAQIRLFRNRIDFRYEGVIHEIIPALSEARSKMIPIRIIHRGYLNEEVTNRNKINRNITLLEKSLSKRPKDPWLNYYLGNEMLRADHPYKADQRYSDALQYLQHEVWIPDLPLKYATSAWQSGDLQKSIELLKQGLLHTPRYTDLWYVLAMIYYDQNLLEKASQAFEKCLELGEAPSAYQTLEGVGTFRPSYYLGLIALEKDDLQGGRRGFVQAISYCPAFQPAIVQLCLCDWIVDAFDEARSILQATEAVIENNNRSWIDALYDLTDIFATRRLSLDWFSKEVHQSSLFSALESLSHFDRNDVVGSIFYQLPNDGRRSLSEQPWLYKALSNFWRWTLTCLEDLRC